MAGEAAAPEASRNVVPLPLRIFQIILIVAMLPLAIAPFVYTGEVIAYYPYSIDREEGFLLNQAMELTRGHTIYPSIAHEPYTVGNYPPVYPALYAMVLKLGGNGLAAGRTLCALAILGIAGFLAGIVYTLSRNWFGACLAPLLFLATYEVNYWIPFARVDLPALCFTMAGLFVFCKVERRSGLIVAAVLLALAVFTKQTEVLAPLACGLSLLVGRRFRDAAIFGGVFATVGIVAGVSLIAATDGEFWKHLVVYNQNKMHWRAFTAILPHIRFFYGTLILAAVLLAVLHARSISSPGERAVCCYALLAICSIISIAKEGSDVNYLLSAEAGVALFTGVFVCKGAMFSSSERLWRRGIAAISVFLLCVHVVLMWMQPEHGIIAKIPPDRNSRRAADAVLLEISESKGENLTEDAIFTILNHRPVNYQPFIMTQLAKEGKWDQSSFVSDLKSGRFSVIVTNECLGPDCFVEGFTDAMRAVILENYVLKETIPIYGRQERFVYTLKTDRTRTP